MRYRAGTGVRQDGRESTRAPAPLHRKTNTKDTRGKIRVPLNILCFSNLEKSGQKLSPAEEIPPGQNEPMLPKGIPCLTHTSVLLQPMLIWHPFLRWYTKSGFKTKYHRHLQTFLKICRHSGGRSSKNSLQKEHKM